jgi:predicted phosphodiesterase
VDDPVGALKIGVVGDLSGGDPARLSAVLDNALIACDHVVQVGDLTPAYEQMRSRLLTSGHKLHVVPGNHDANFDTLNVPRNWRFTTPDHLVTMIGIDNSTMHLGDEAKSMFAKRGSSKYGFVFAHMAPWPIILPDGSENRHTMVEGGPNPDADWLVDRLRSRADVMVAGHYHGWTMQQAPWGPLIVEGRGGAAPDLGYTLMTVTPNGWVLHSVGVNL